MPFLSLRSQALRTSAFRSPSALTVSPSLVRAKSRNWLIAASMSSMSFSIPGLSDGIALVVEHLEAQPNARERRAQVVRDAGEEQRALVVQALQVGRHLVERAGQRADLRWPGFGNRRRNLAASHRFRGARQRAQRAIDAEHDEPRADERQRQHERPPADPAQGLAAARCGCAGCAPRRDRRRS